MTLILVVANKNISIQVADRRLTTVPGARLVDDQAMKTVLIKTWDAKLAISYTGTASINGLRTDRWIGNQMRQATASKLTFLNAMDLLRDKLSEASTRRALNKDIGLTLAVNGLGNTQRGDRRPAIAWITNREEPVVGKTMFRDLVPPGWLFQRYVVDPDCGWYIFLGGAVVDGVPIAWARKELVRRLNRFGPSDDPEPLERLMLEICRFYRRHPLVKPVVGEHWVATAVRADFSAQTRYFGFARDGHVQMSVS